MIDLNHVGPQLDDGAEYDLDALSERLAERAYQWVPPLFPHGIMDGPELRLANIQGDAPRKNGSCIIQLKGKDAGSWYDHSTGKGGKALSTLAMATRLRGADLFERAAELAGLQEVPRKSQLTPPVNRQPNGHLTPPVSWLPPESNRPPAPPPPAVPDYATIEIARILAGCIDVAGSPGERYLAGRGLAVPAGLRDLRYNDDILDHAVKRNRPALIGVIRDPATGQPTGGIHRTYLTDDGAAKADIPKPKMMLGPSAGVVMLLPIGPDGVLGVAEGIETALAAAQLFRLPVWAALSTSGIKKFELPPGLRRLVVFADKGEGGEKAATELYQRAAAAGIAVQIVLPRSDDDFNADLTAGLWPADAALPATGDLLPPPPVATLGFNDLCAVARRLNQDSPELDDVLRAVLKFNPLAQERLLKEISRSTRYTVPGLRKTLKAFEREAEKERKATPDWFGELETSDSGDPKPIMLNVAVALRNDERWRGVLGRNEFTGRIRVLRRPPWGDVDWPGERDWIDDDELKTTEWMQAIGICAPRQIVFDAVESVANENRFHPVRDWLDGLAWDGVARLDRWLTAYAGAADTPYTRAVGSRFLISAVARIYQPGCKADCVLILEGKQGLMKSTALRVLFDPWFTDEIAELGSKDAAMAMQGVWCIELAELEALKRADSQRLKAFVSRTTDRFRPPYGRQIVDAPRQCVFAGTVNDLEYLRDPTGARRFWPVRCTAIDINLLQGARDQLLAEAVVRYRKRHKWYLDEPELIDAAADQQSSRETRDPWIEVIGKWIAEDPTRIDDGVSTLDLLQHAIRKFPHDCSHSDSIRVGICAAALGLQKRQKRAGSDREYRYYRAGTPGAVAPAS